MTANDAFFTRKQAAAVLKHGVLSRYPTVFASMAGWGEAEVVLYDGYAGPGRYEDGSEGSPLLLVETAQRVAKFRKVRLLFSEEDLDTHTELNRTLTQAAGEAVQWDADYGPVEQWAPVNVRIADEAPMLTFLDPFGVGLSYDVLTKILLGRPANLKTEVLLNINIESVRRIGGHLRRLEQGYDAASAKTVATVDDFLGDDWWHEEFRSVRDRSTAAAAARHVVDEFCKRVLAATGFYSFKVPIRRRPGHEPLFILTLFYRHDVAPWKFNDAASMANKEWRQACLEADLERELQQVPVEANLFGDEEENRQLMRDAKLAAWENQEALLEKGWVQAIAENLEWLLMKSSFVNLGPSIVDVYGTTLGLARESHVRKAWDLLNDRKVALPRDKKLKTLAKGVVYGRSGSSS
jgi:three-Cys-motif partner protein